MPIYEYYCSKCREEYELKRPTVDMNNVAPCPKCGGNGKYVHPC